MTKRLFRVAASGLSVLLLAACATLDPDYEEPTVSLAGIRALPSQGGMPNFEVKLHIVNPNDFDLDLEGIVYTIALDGHDLVKSVGKDFPVIESYSEETVTLTGSVSLLDGIRLLADLVQSSGNELDYAFKAKLDMGGLHPSIRVNETGTLDLSGQLRQ